jgi:hypothetical protein
MSPFLPQQYYQARAALDAPRAWSTLFTLTTANNSTAWNGFGIVNQLAAIASLGAAYRLTLTPPTSGADYVISSVWIGMANTAPSFDGNQVQVKFSGLNGVTLTAGGADVVSDPISPTVNFNTSGNLLVAIGVTSGDVRRSGVVGYANWAKAGDAANAGATSKSGYALQADVSHALTKLEAWV